MGSFIDSVKKLFANCRNVDTRYFRRLSELGECIEELPFCGDEDQEMETTKVSSLIALCHDGHQELLLAEEAKLQGATAKWKEDFLRRFRKRERKRNRDRILELNHFVDTMRQEEDEMADALPPPVAGGAINVDGPADEDGIVLIE